MDNILDLIPQRAPIVMVDEFLGIQENLSRTRLTVSKENIFVDNDRMSECGLIEHIAQSAAKLARRLVGEGYGGYLPRAGNIFAEKMA